MRQFGAAFGTAYQVYDDCVDLFGSETAAGKSLGTDLAKGKLTWPVLLAWERANGADRAHLESLIQHWQPENLSAVNQLLVRYETFEPSPGCHRQVSGAGAAGVESFAGISRAGRTFRAGRFFSATNRRFDC